MVVAEVWTHVALSRYSSLVRRLIDDHSQPDTTVNRFVRLSCAELGVAHHGI